MRDSFDRYYSPEEKAHDPLLKMPSTLRVCDSMVPGYLSLTLIGGEAGSARTARLSYRQILRLTEDLNAYVAKSTYGHILRLAEEANARTVGREHIENAEERGGTLC